MFLTVFEQAYGLNVCPAFCLRPALAEMVVGDAEVPRPTPRLLAELLQRRILSRLYVRKARPLAVQRDVYGGQLLL